MNLSHGYLGGRVAIVTGSGSGIGRAIAQKFAAAGATVVVAEREVERGTGTVATISAHGGNARFIPCDVADSGNVRNLVQETIRAFGRLDILVNNAGIPGPSASADLYRDDDWD